MVLIVLAVEGDEGGAHPKMDKAQKKADGIIGLSGEFSCKISHRFSNRCEFIDGYMLIASTDDIVTSSLFNPISSSVSFRSEAWTMELSE